MRRLAGAVAVLVLLVLVAATGCSGADGSSASTPATVVPTPQRGGSITYGMDADPNGLDPMRNAWDTAGLLVAGSLYDTWTAYDTAGVAQPYLAQALDHDADFLTWTLRLRPGIRFHNGQPLDAAAAVANLQGFVASAVTGDALGDIAAATEVDPLTVQITMKQPWAAFPATLTGQGGTVVAPAQINDPEGYIHPIGTGPFKLAGWDIGEQVSVVRNESYWRQGLPYLDKVTFKVVAESKDRVSALEAGDLDIAGVGQADDVRQLDSLAGADLSVEHDPGPPEPTFVMFDTDRAPFDDPDLRLAVAHATDVKALAAAVGWPPESLASGPFAADSPWHADVPYPDFDPVEARRLVAKHVAAGGESRFTLTGAYSVDAMQVLAEQWKAVGLDVDVKVVDPKGFALLSVVGEFQAMFMQFFSTPDPDTLVHFWGSAARKPSGALSLNFSRLTDPDIDAALTTGRASGDPATRKAAYTTVQQRFAALLPYVWLHHVRYVVGHRSSVHDARNLTLPDGRAAMPFAVGIHRLTETWVG